jgi:hypothetical protein
MDIAAEKYTDAPAKTTRPTEVFTKTVRLWIDRRWAHRRGASKLLAALASHGEHKVSHRTTEEWIRGDAAPSWDSIFIMAARCEDLAASLAEDIRSYRDGIA